MSGLSLHPRDSTTSQGPAQAPSTQGISGNGKGDVPLSNSEQQEKLRTKEGTPEGKASFQDMLGQWLGGELYKVVAPQLTLQALEKDANQALSAGIKALVGQLGNIKGDVDKKAIGNFGKALAAQYGNLAGKLLETDMGKHVATSLANWVDVNPRTVLQVALLAAAAAVLADMDVPTLKQKFGLTKGLSAEVEAKLGSFQHLALDDIKANLSYTSGPLVAAVQAEHKGDTDKVGASVKGIPITDHLTGRAGIQHTTTDKDGERSNVETVSGGLTYNDKKNLNLSLDAQASTDHSGKVAGRGTYKPNEHLTLGAHGEYDWGKNTAYSFGGSAAYKDEKNRLEASANYASKNHQLDLSVMGQRNLNEDFAVQGNAGFRSSDKGERYSAGLHGAYFLDKDTAILGGGRYILDEDQKSHFIPEVGAQVKGVPLMLGYDPQDKAVTFGAGFHF